MAIHAHTTATSRRDVLCSSGALLALAGIAATPVDEAPESPDARLIALAAELAAHQAEIDALEEDATDTWDRLGVMLDRFWQIAGEAEDARATTMDGLRAKARVLRLVFDSTEGPGESPASRHMAGLIRDLTGEG